MPSRDFLFTSNDSTAGRPIAPGMYRNLYNQLLQNQVVPSVNFDASATMPIPGVTGPTAPGAPVTQPVMPPQTFATPFQANGQYGLLAQQLAGVQSPGMQIPQQPSPAQSYGLLGPKRISPLGGK